MIRFKKFRADDATAAPDGGDVAEVQVPIELAAGRAEQFHALGVGDDLRGVERVAHGVDQLVAIAGEFLDLRLRQNFRGRDPLVFPRGNDARFDRGVDRGNDDGLLECADCRVQMPVPFLSGLVEDDIDQRLAGVRDRFCERSAR